MLSCIPDYNSIGAMRKFWLQLSDIDVKETVGYCEWVEDVEVHCIALNEQIICVLIEQKLEYFIRIANQKRIALFDTGVLIGGGGNRYGSYDDWEVRLGKEGLFRVGDRVAPVIWERIMAKADFVVAIWIILKKSGLGFYAVFSYLRSGRFFVLMACFFLDCFW